MKKKQKETQRGREIEWRVCVSRCMCAQTCEHQHTQNIRIIDINQYIKSYISIRQTHANLRYIVLMRPPPAPILRDDPTGTRLCLLHAAVDGSNDCSKGLQLLQIEPWSSLEMAKKVLDDGNYGDLW